MDGSIWDARPLGGRVHSRGGTIWEKYVKAGLRVGINAPTSVSNGLRQALCRQGANDSFPPFLSKKSQSIFVFKDKGDQTMLRSSFSKSSSCHWLTFSTMKINFTGSNRNRVGPLSGARFVSLCFPAQQQKADVLCWNERLFYGQPHEHA